MSLEIISSIRAALISATSAGWGADVCLKSCHVRGPAVALRMHRRIVREEKHDASLPLFSLESYADYRVHARCSLLSLNVIVTCQNACVYLEYDIRRSMHISAC